MSLRNGQKYITSADIPEMDKPTTVLGGKEGLADGHTLEIHMLHLPNELESGKENDRQWRAIILQEHPNRMVEQIAVPDETRDIAHNQNQQCNRNRKICGCFTGSPLESEDLYAFLEVEDCYIEAFVRCQWADASNASFHSLLTQRYRS